MPKAPDLREIPPLPKEIPEAASSGELILFVGAGVSMLQGLPLWKDWAKAVLEDLRKQDLLNFSDIEQLQKLDPRKQLSIAKLLVEDLDFSIHVRSSTKESRIYEYINNIGCTCVTTNYDELLSPIYNPKQDGSTLPSSVKRINNVNEFYATHLNLPATVIHLHGSVSNPETMIVTTKDYLEHYDNETLHNFLGELFIKKVVLFIGYGLEEAEILEHILRRGGARKTKPQPQRLFVLQGFFNSEKPLYSRLSKYYSESFGVGLIGFDRDNKNYDQLEDIMKDWSEKIKVRPSALTADLDYMDEVLANENTPKEKDLLIRINKKPELQPFFFRKVKGLHWFDSLEKEGYFAPDKNPQPIPAEQEGYVMISPWLALEYLVTTVPEIETTQNKEYGENFLKIIREATQYAKENKFSNWRTWWQFAQILRQLPVDIVKENDLDLVDYWFDDNFGQSFLTDELIINWLPKLISGNTHSKQLALKLIDIVFSPNKDNKIRFQIWYINHKSKDLFTSIGKEIGLEAAKILESKLTTVLDKLQNDLWSYVRRSAIEEHEQNHQADDAIDILIVAYRDCLLEITNDNSVESKEYLQKLLNSSYETLKRVAIYIISQRFDQFKGLSELIIVQEYFSKNNLRHELWNFLNQHYKDFANEEKKKVIEIINNIVRHHDDEPNKRATAYGKSIWLKAIKDFDEQLAIQYQDAVNTSGTEPEHPDFASYMTVRSGNSQSTIPSDTVEEWKKSQFVKNLIEAVEKYKTLAIPDRFEDWGIIQTFNDIIKEKIKVGEVYQELSKLDDIDLAYKRYIIDMFHNAWNEKIKLPWDDIWPNLFEFCKKIIDNENFWIAEKQQTEEYYSTENRNLVSSISNLIEDGVKSDDHAFAPKLLPEAKKILLLILEKQKGDEFKFDTDAVSLALNSPRGRCLIALLSLSLRECRLSDQENGEVHIDKWGEYQHIYESELEKSKEYEFVTILTFRLPNFVYLSKQWVMENLDKIFDKDDYQKWLCTMQGMVYVNPYGEVIYKYLYTHGYLINVLDEKNLKKEVKESVIQNIAMAYIHDYESLDNPDSAIYMLLQRHNHDELSHLIWFISTARRKDIPNIYNKIFKLWPKLIDILDLTTKEDKKLASSLCRWSTFISEINDSNRNLLLKIAPYSDRNQNSYELLENLAKISRTQPLEVYAIWREMTKSDIFYPKDAIREILSNLVLNGNEKQAIEIVDEYIKVVNDEPKRILEEIKNSS